MAAEGLTVSIRADGVDVSARLSLESIGSVTATARMAVRTEFDVLLLEPHDIKVEGAPNALLEGAATLLVAGMLQDPRLMRLTLPYGRPQCVELAEGRLRIAVLWNTPTPTNTPLPPRALATLFPDNPVYGLRNLARAGAEVVPHAINDRDTGFLLGLEGTITFPPSVQGPVRQMLLDTLDPLLTGQMRLRQQDEGVEDYCGCALALRLGNMIVDLCWSGGQHSDGVYGKIYTRLPVINARVSPQFGQILSDWEKLR